MSRSLLICQALLFSLFLPITSLTLKEDCGFL